MTTFLKIPQLYCYSENNNKVFLPKWAQFYLNIGNSFYENLPKDNNKRARLVMTVPIRGFASVLIAYSAIVSSIFKEEDQHIIEKHFQHITNIKEGTSVLFRQKNRIYRGKYAGVESVNGEIRIKITIQEKKAGNLTYLLTKEQALNVNIVEDKDYHLPKNPLGRKNDVPKFLENGFKGLDYHRLLTHSQTRIYFVGRKNLIKDEALKTYFALKDCDSNTFVSGYLNEVLRIKEFIGEQAAFQSQILSESSSENLIDMQNKTPKTITIFDGSISYLRWREDFKSTHSILILDRTEPQFESAIFECIDEYTINPKCEKKLLVSDELIPHGVELMYWEEDLKP
jgi:hypothetical protein